VPMNPFHLHVRPVVLPVTSELKVKLVGGRYGATVYADGIESALLKVGQEVNIRKYDEISFIVTKRDYYSRVNRRITVDP